MGLSEEEIGQLTLLEFDTLLKRKKAADNRVRFNAGIVAAAVLNTAAFGDPNRKPASPIDFVPDWKPKEKDLTEMSPQEQKYYIMNQFFKRSFRR